MADGVSPVMAAATHPFERLSDELKGLVIKHIIRPTDLRNVCLVNSQFHELAVPYLYREISLDLGGPNDTNLLTFLSAKNIGLKHIRELRLNLAPAPERANTIQQAHFSARMLIEWLPEDTLEDFSWRPWKPFSYESLQLLYKRQRKLKWLEAIDLDKPILPLLKTNPQLSTSIFQNVSRMGIYPENRQTLELGGFFLENAANKLEELIVRCKFDLDMRRSDDIETRELNDTAGGPGLFSRSLFGHLLRTEKCEPLKNLTNLSLESVNLRHCARTWCRFINFHNIESLSIQNCHGAESLIGKLCTADSLPKKLTNFEFQHRDHPDDDAMSMVDEFLCLVSGIRTLTLDFCCVKTLPAAKSIVRHAKTLEVLSVHSCENDPTLLRGNPPRTEADEVVWEVEEFLKICKACKGLEELSCAWPSRTIHQGPKTDWKAFEAAILSLKRLITLHITTWPSNKITTQSHIQRQAYEVLLAGIAQRMFSLSAKSTQPRDSHSRTESGTDTEDDDDLPVPMVIISSNSADAQSQSALASDTASRIGKLRLIAFGSSDRINERQDSPNQIIYWHSTCIDARGREQPHATPIGWCLRQFVEPHSEVLDFVLMRSGRDFGPPFRAARGGWPTDSDEYVSFIRRAFAI